MTERGVSTLDPCVSRSTFNKQVQEVFDSPLSQTHAFVEKAYLNELEEDEIIYSIDINKCRKNTLYYGGATLLTTESTQDR